MALIRFIIFGSATLLISAALIYLLAAEMTRRSQSPEKTRLGNGRSAAGIPKHN
jgi:hypothetical protein